MKPKLPLPRGQALPLGLLCLAVVALAWVQGYGLRQVASARMRLSHIADAVAYSGALAQARTFNLLAWTSRTQLAHQMAMAHIATLAAWAGFGGRQANRSAVGNPPAFLVSSLFGTRYGSAYSASAAMVSPGSTDGWAYRYLQHDRLVHEALGQVREAALDSMVTARQAAMEAVLSENLAGAFSGFSGQSYSSDDVRLSILNDSLAGSVQERSPQAPGGIQALLSRWAQDTPFLATRNVTARNGYPVSPYCPHLRHELRRRGATVLDAAGRWQALDTLSFHALRSNRWVGCYFRPYPMGWAWAAPSGLAPDEAHVSQPPQGFGDEAFWRWLQGNTNWPLLGTGGNPLATSYAVAAPIRLSSRGLPSELAVIEPMPGFTIHLSLSRQWLSTTDAASRIAMFGLWRFAGLGGAGRLEVRSAAATEYVRPQGRPDGQLELPNLFQPYWQARLMPLPSGPSGMDGQLAVSGGQP